MERYAYVLEDFLTMSVRPKVIYRSTAVPIKIPKTFSCRNRNIHPKIHMESQETPGRPNKVGGLTF